MCFGLDSIFSVELFVFLRRDRVFSLIKHAYVHLSLHCKFALNTLVNTFPTVYYMHEMVEI